MNHIGVLPYTSYRTLESQADDADTGVGFIYQPTANFIGNLTVFPDFS